jgi:hypothetical protein
MVWQRLAVSAKFLLYRQQPVLWQLIFALTNQGFPRTLPARAMGYSRSRNCVLVYSKWGGDALDSVAT